MFRRKQNTQFAVFGLGQFGMGLVESLAEYNVNILACDRDSLRINEAMEYATHVVQLDVGDEAAMERLELKNFDVIVFAISGDFEAVLMAVMRAKEKGARRIIVKARGEMQKKILESIGVDEVILPEREMGAKAARALVKPNILEVLEDSEHYTIAEIKPQDDWLGKTVREADIRNRHDITILAVRRDEKMHIPVSPSMVIREGDVLLSLQENKPAK